MRKIFLTTLIITALISAVYAQNAKTKTLKSCEVGGYVADTDPNGLNVRSKPDKSSEILSRLIKGTGEISVDIIGASGTGWLKITNAWHGDRGDLFKETGWVFASMLATSAKGSPNYDAPGNLYLTASKKAKVVRQIPSEAEVQLLDCSGTWAKVSYKGSTGWLADENQCGNPFTTCS